MDLEKEQQWQEIINEVSAGVIERVMQAATNGIVSTNKEAVDLLMNIITRLFAGTLGPMAEDMYKGNIPEQIKLFDEVIEEFIEKTRKFFINAITEFNAIAGTSEH